MQIREALTFDDVLLVPAHSSTLPKDVCTRTFMTKKIELGIPIISSAMDTVTESNLAIALAQAGGIGVVHKNMTVERQANEVRRVKRFESGMVVNPITIAPEKTLSDALSLMEENSISGIPVVAKRSGRLLGILTHRDVRFAIDPAQPVRELMTRRGLVTVKDGVDKDEAKRLLHKHKIEKLLVIDDDRHCVGLITVKDIDKAQRHPNACKDENGSLRVAAAVGVGTEGLERAEALLDAGCDVIVIDTAHGHTDGVIQTVEGVKKLSNYAQVVAGNVATGDGAKALIDCGADAIKVGIGPGSICTTRIVAGVGMPQLTAVMDAVEVGRKQDIPIIADGGIKFSGDLAKAIAAGASGAMVGSLFAGTDEAPGDIHMFQGRPYKSYRGMGSVGAMARGSADRYFQEEVTDTLKLVPEGVEGQVPYKGSVGTVIHQLVGGLRAAMGYTGNVTLSEMQRNCNFIRVTDSGLREGHVHDVTVTREAPNYRVQP
ncbi:MAG: IMP dehydrogenase [Alphaproteobacteria bacterium]|nr:IMP dehydrogenase [Alphaproteobacteria bacterium]